MLARFSVLSAVLLAVGCGAVDNTSAFGDTTPEDHRDPNCFGCTGPLTTVEGSYELEFTSVDRTDGKTTSGVPLADARVSLTNRARLDVGQPDAAGHVTVLLTGRWNEIATFDGTLTATELTIRAGKAALGAGDATSDFHESNTWTELRFPRTSNGNLAGTFTATGELFASAGDVVDSFPIAGAGKVSTDRRAPAIRLEPPRRSRAGQWLPWDPIAIRFAEPLRRDALDAMIAVLPEVGFPPIGDASAKPDDPIAGLYGWATTFGTNGQTRTLTAPSNVFDRNGNALQPFTAALSFRDVGAPKVKHELDAGFASWGSVVLASDARCESGACVVFPAEEQNHCDTPSGIAGRLAIGGPATGKAITAVHARVRVLAGSAMTDSQPYVIEPLRFEVVSGAQVEMKSLQGPLTKDGTGETPWTTAWTTIDVPISGMEAGFSFVRTSCDSQGGLPLPQAKVSVIVDSVWAD